MNKKAIIWIIALILLATATQAAILDDIIGNWNFNNHANDTLNNYNFTLFDHTTYHAEPGAIGTACIYFDGTNDYAQTTIANTYNRTTTLTINLWWNVSINNGGNTNNVILDLWEGVGESLRIKSKDDAADEIQIRHIVTGADPPVPVQQSPVDNTWYMITAVNNETHMCLYVNATRAQCLGNTNGSMTNLRIGATSVIDRDAEGCVDELTLWNRTLTQGEITRLYNAGNGVEYPFVVSNFSIQISDFWNGSTINTFNATVNGTTYNTTGGTLNTPIDNALGALMNITIRANGYNARSLQAYNITTDIDTWMTQTGTSQNLIVNVLNPYGVMIAQGNVTVNGTTQASNPFSNNILNYISMSNPTAKINVIARDITNRYASNTTNGITINNTKREINMTLPSNQLDITFYQHGSLTNTSGVVIHNQTYNFTDSTIIVQHDGIPNGYDVKIHYNYNIRGNYTQFYEYLNNYSSITLNLEVLDKADSFIWFQVLDQSNSPIEDANIIMQEAYATSSTTGTNFTTIGRRLTNGEGYTSFFFDSGTEYRAIVTADGYNPIIEIGTIGTIVQADKSEAITIRMTESDDDTAAIAGTTFYKYFTNRSQPIYGVTIAPTYNVIQFNTSYKSGLTTATDDALGRYILRLNPGEHFNTTGNTNITVYIYGDGTLIHSRTILYDAITKTEVFDFTEDTNIINPIIAILLIGLAGLAGTIFQGKGKTAFIIGTIGAALISQSYIMLMTLAILHIVLRQAHKVMSE